MRWQLVLLLCAAAQSAHGLVSRTFYFPFTPFQSALVHIHSPETFIETHGLCPEGFCLEKTSAPVRVEDYHVVTLTYSTPLAGRMHARVFTDHPQRSHFLLMDAERRPVVMGQFRVARYGHMGHCMLLRASRLQPWGSILDGLRWVPSDATVETSIREAAASTRERPGCADLAEYRRRVLFVVSPGRNPP